MVETSRSRKRCMEGCCEHVSLCLLAPMLGDAPYDRRRFVAFMLRTWKFATKHGDVAEEWRLFEAFFVGIITTIGLPQSLDDQLVAVGTAPDELLKVGPGLVAWASPEDLDRMLHGGRNAV